MPNKDCISCVNVRINSVWSRGNYVCHFFRLHRGILWERWAVLVPEEGTATNVRALSQPHPTSISAWDVCYYTLTLTYFERREGEKKKKLIYASTVTLSCLHLWKQNSSEFQQFLTLSTYKVKFSLTLHNAAGSQLCTSCCSEQFRFILLLL